MKRILILGSTGSIGLAALDVIREHPELYSVVGLSAHTGVNTLLEQAQAFGVKRLALTGAAAAGPEFITSPDAAVKLVQATEPDIVLNGIAGSAGFLPSLAAVRMGATLALANKESLVVGGKFIRATARKSGAAIIPVDSEHSAVFQCLEGERHEDIARIILTASGGPFYDRPQETFGAITPEEALNHPVWRMGKRITIDSATMMNKALEIIEAAWLFDLPEDRIDVCVHPQGIVHSLVEFKDSSIKAQLSLPDMRLPIAIALAWPERIETGLKRLDFSRMPALTFTVPDETKFRALRIGRQALSKPDTAPCIMNAADEVAIKAFLDRRIPFTRITELVEKTMETLWDEHISGPEDLLDLDRKARLITEGLIPCS